MVKHVRIINNRHDNMAEIKQEIKQPANLSSIVASFVPVYGEVHSYFTGRNEWSAYRTIIPTILRTTLMTASINFAYEHSTTVAERAQFSAEYMALALAGNMLIYLAAHPKSLSELANDYKREAKDFFSNFFEQNKTC